MYPDVCSMGNTALPAPQPTSRMDVGLSWLLRSQCLSLKICFGVDYKMCPI